MDIFLGIVLFLIGAPVIGLMALGFMHLTALLYEWLLGRREHLDLYFGKYGGIIGLYLVAAAVYLVVFIFYYG